MGDFNIDLLKHKIHNPTSSFIDCLFSNYFLPLIHKPTRITETTATLIDNIFTNFTDLSLKSATLFCDISDHLPIFQIASLDGQSHRGNGMPSFFRCINFRTINEFHCGQQDFGWDALFLCDNPNNSYDVFISNLSNLYHAHFPIRCVHRTKQFKPWMTTGVLNSIKHKNKLYKKFLSTPNNVNRSIYNRFRNKLNHVIKEVKAKPCRVVLQCQI